MLYSVLRQDGSRIGIDHLVDGAIAQAERDDALDAARYHITVDDYLESLTFSTRASFTTVPHALTMAELESFAQLHNGASRLLSGIAGSDPWRVPRRRFYAMVITSVSRPSRLD